MEPHYYANVRSWHIPAVATAAKDGRSRLESGRWRSAARWLPERELSEKAPGVWLGSQILGVRAARLERDRRRQQAQPAWRGSGFSPATMALRANMAGGFKSASTPENPDNPWFFSENATGSRAQSPYGRAPGCPRAPLGVGAALFL